MQKTIFIIFLLAVMGTIIFPAGLALAADDGSSFLPIVPCGREGTPACNLCHIFVLIKNVFAFTMFRIVPAIAIIMIIWGGLYFLTSAGNEERVKKGRTILTRAIVGLVIAYAAFLIVGTVLGILSQAATGGADTKALFKFQNGNIIIDCAVTTVASEEPEEEEIILGTCPPNVNPNNYPDDGCAGCVSLNNIVQVKPGVGGIFSNNPRVAPSVYSTLQNMIQTSKNNGLSLNDWRITEAYCPEVAHADKDHYNGHAIDVALTGVTTVEKVKKLCSSARQAGFNVLNEYTNLGNQTGPECPAPKQTTTTTGQHLHLEN